MKPVLRKITSTPELSFLVRKDVGEEMLNNWHYHPEVELLLIKKSSGTWLIGDHIGHFQSGDIVFLGANLPHCFRHEYDYIIKKKEPAGESICIKFIPDIFGSRFFEMPETKKISALLSNSGYGLKLSDKIKKIIAGYMVKMLEVPPAKKLVYLLLILEEIANGRAYTELSSKGYMQYVLHKDTERIEKIFEYTFKHYSEKINIESVAALCNMTSPSFCRYFKSKTNKTYVQFLTEVRIGYACKLLVEDEKNVSEISFQCGYNNISNFNQQFKMITKKSPLKYKKDYLKPVIFH